MLVKRPGPRNHRKTDMTKAHPHLSTPALVWNKIDTFAGNSNSPILTAHRRCPVCNGLEQRTFLIFEDFQFYSDSALVPKRTKIREVQCQNCHALYLDPGYSEAGFEILFAQAGRSFGSSAAHQQAQADWLRAKSLAEPGQALLDVGCYDGHFLSLLPQKVRKFGVDMDLPAIERGLSRYASLGLNLTHGSFENFQSPVQPDVITMFHVLEHLYDPHKVLRNLHINAHRETRLVVEVPILEKGYTNDINGFFSIQHQTHFSLNSLSQIMRRAGWKIVDSEEMADYNGYRILALRSEENPGEMVVGDVADRVKLLDYFQAYSKNLFEIAGKIASWPESAKTVIWGAGAHTEFLYQVTPYFLKNRNTEFILVDQDPLKHNTSWRGLGIYDPAIVKQIDWSECALVISSYGGQPSIAKAAVACGVPAAAIRTLYDYVRAY